MTANAKDGFHINPLLLRYNQVTTRPGFCNESTTI